MGGHFICIRQPVRKLKKKWRRGELPFCSCLLPCWQRLQQPCSLAGGGQLALAEGNAVQEFVAPIQTSYVVLEICLTTDEVREIAAGRLAPNAQEMVIVLETRTARATPVSDAPATTRAQATWTVLEEIFAQVEYAHELNLKLKKNPIESKLL